MDGQSDVLHISPISKANTVSAISSPACGPTMPAPKILLLTLSKSSLVMPSSRVMVMARPLAAREILLSHKRYPAFRLRFLSAPSGNFRIGIGNRGNGTCIECNLVPSNDFRRNLTFMGCFMRQHGISGNITNCKICGTLVRICLSTGMNPRSSTLIPAAPASISFPFGRRPTATSTRSYRCGSGACSPSKNTCKPSLSASTRLTLVLR